MSRQAATLCHIALCSLLPPPLLSSGGAVVTAYTRTRARRLTGDFNLGLLDLLLEEKRMEMISCCNELNAG